MQNVPRTTIVSSNLEAIEYNAETKELQVEFKNKSIYAYEGVSAELMQEFLESEENPEFKSYGKFFNSKIKADKKISFRKIRDAAPKAAPGTKYKVTLQLANGEAWAVQQLFDTDQAATSVLVEKLKEKGVQGGHVTPVVPETSSLNG